MLLVHAHPDDESLTTGGTIARAVRAGAEVTVLTCTLGEEGEVIGERWAQLAADHADQLGGYRIGELTAALAALGVDGPRFLLGAGHFRDSGMAGTPSAAHPRAFARSGDDAVAAAVAVIRELRPHVVVTYAADGGYGHPDHVRAHEVTALAVAAAADSGRYPEAGEPWDVPKLYWTVAAASEVECGLERIADVPDGWRMPEPGELPCVPDDEVTAEIDVSDVIDAKRAAFAAHATQVTVAPSGAEFALSNAIVQPIPRVEHFVLAKGEAGPRDESGRETDLFGGLAESR
ncbi:N-acetyl-1-D-myo-inositol-2-amino-2-deoxy-alpha-D-glucopyranoside deacetylase [Rhodococcus rhodnii]|uniref:1D-myo-inositol 2-acetamido-2-deoxy-alpha-D-glucopyranoside deacetylase n=2 Tax=Rhodococcus rhodnii TaxID=38312 RepID=R7WLF5_9NOCA|nr:LMBE-related protein [Rhodococcus rhodnii LMG 5362]